MSTEDSKNQSKPGKSLTISTRVFKPKAAVAASTIERPTAGLSGTTVSKYGRYDGSNATSYAEPPAYTAPPFSGPPIGRPDTFGVAVSTIPPASLSQSTATKPSNGMSLGSKTYMMKKEAKSFVPKGIATSTVTKPVEASVESNLTLGSKSYKPKLNANVKSFVPKAAAQSTDASEQKDSKQETVRDTEVGLYFTVKSLNLGLKDVLRI